MSFKISKSFNVTYSHRLHNQGVGIGACGAENKCRQIHGHNGVVKIKLSAKDVNDKGMVTDFADLNWLKKELDEVIDHKTILYKEDPMLKLLFAGVEQPYPYTEFNAHPVITPLKEYEPMNGYLPHWKYFGGGHEKIYRFDKLLDCPRELKEEYFQSFVLVDFIPTAENLAKWVYYTIWEHQFDEDSTVQVHSVKWKESENSSATYKPNPHKL